MRTFLVYKKNNFKMSTDTYDSITVLGIINSDSYPSTIANDRERCIKEYGTPSVFITEIKEKCNVTL